MSHQQEPREPAARSSQQPMQHGGGQQMGQPQHMVLDFEDTLTRDMRVALHDVVKAATICNWCADACLGEREMEECARLCRDVADLAALNIQFISRDSTFGIDVAETFAHAAEECAQVCAQFPHEHCQECASVLRRATDSTWAMLDSFQHAPQGGQQHQQSQLQQY